MIEIARWLMLLTLFLSPWLYGGVPAWTRPIFAAGLLVSFAIWILGHLLQRRWPVLPRLLPAALGLLALHGLLLWGNAQYWYDRFALEFVKIPHPWVSSSWLPGALDSSETGPLLLGLAGVMAAVCVFTDLARIRIWRTRLLIALLSGGMAVVVFGIIQRLLNHPLGFWGEFDRDRNYFGPFLYHGNAGAFVNLLVPALTGWSVMNFLQPAQPRTISRFLPPGALVLVLIASVAIASKAAMVFTVGLAAISAALFVRQIRRQASVAEARSRWSPTSVVIVLAILLCVPLLGFERARERWAEWPSAFGLHSARALGWQASWRMLPDAGLWGIGPGNFQFAFPHYTYGLGPEVAGFWQFTHQDYLQTAIEWGWIGFILWAIVLGGWLCRHQRAGSAEGDAIRLAARIALAGVLVHALLDYPLQIPAIQLYVGGWLAFLWAEQARTGQGTTKLMTNSPATP